MDPSFLRVPQAPVATRSGPVLLPLLYPEASHFGVLFRVDLGRAREVMGRDRSIEPLPLLGGALAAIYVWQYRDSTLGPYNEVGLGIQARRKGTRPSVLRLLRDMGAQDDQGIWVVDLPVSTPPPFEAGVDLWGYPKYVTEIDVRFEPDRSHVGLAGELELSLARPRGPRLRGQPVVTYTARAGRLLRTCIEVDHHVVWGTGRGVRLELRGQGPLVDSVRRLGLATAPRLGAFRCEEFRARVPAGVDLGPL